MTSYLDDPPFLIEPDEPAVPPPPPKWLRPNAPRITLDDCVNASGPMQRMLPGEVHGKGGVKSGGKPVAKQQAGVMTFGKYRAKLILDVREDDPAYLRWCISEDIQGMREKCAAVGITEDDL